MSYPVVQEMSTVIALLVETDDACHAQLLEDGHVIFGCQGESVQIKLNPPTKELKERPLVKKRQRFVLKTVLKAH